MRNLELFNELKNLNNNGYEIDSEVLKTKIEKKLSGKYKKMFYLKGEIIAKENEKDDVMYFIDRGKVLLCRKDACDKEFSCGYLSAGEFFDIASYINEAYPFTYKAISNCSMYVIEISEIKKLMSENEEDRNYILEQSIKTTRILKIRQGRLIMGGCKKSFANLIIEHIRESGKVDNNGFIVATLDVNLADIAVMINMTRETLSRIVCEMKKDNIIDNKRKFIIIKDLQKFVEISN